MLGNGEEWPLGVHRKGKRHFPYFKCVHCQARRAIRDSAGLSIQIIAPHLALIMKIIASNKKKDPVKSAIYNPKEFRSKRVRAWSAVPDKKTEQTRFQLTLLVILLTIILGGWYLREADNTSMAMPLPVTGEMQRNHQEAPNTIYAPLRLIATESTVSYVVKLESWQTGAPVLTVFVRRGEVADIKVPIGIYRAKYAYGHAWYGPYELFGKETVVAHAVLPLAFVLEPTRVRGQIIDLTPTPTGNLRVAKGGRANF